MADLFPEGTRARYTWSDDSFTGTVVFKDPDGQQTFGTGGMFRLLRLDPYYVPPFREYEPCEVELLTPLDGVSPLEQQVMDYCNRELHR